MLMLFDITTIAIIIINNNILQNTTIVTLPARTHTHTRARTQVTCMLNVPKALHSQGCGWRAVGGVVGHKNLETTPLTALQTPPTALQGLWVEGCGRHPHHPKGCHPTARGSSPKGGGVTGV
jgi:hypothetical protein